jgi:transposase
MLDGPIDGDSCGLVETVLVPTLRPRPHGRHGQSRRAQVPRGPWAIRDAGARRLFPPKYSPDRGPPIEQLFAKLGKAAARTRDAVCGAIGHISPTVIASECINATIEAGYVPAHTRPAPA